MNLLRIWTSKHFLRKTASVLPNTLRALVRTFWSIIRKT
ncbi:Uncharacterised protein [Vibrio cholerae]|nr:Uncharacterised protein [Vibrio cholerae]CSI75929.1 Uncharacterised protein [Vibrio cholerae]